MKITFLSNSHFSAFSYLHPLPSIYPSVPAGLINHMTKERTQRPSSAVSFDSSAFGAMSPLHLAAPALLVFAAEICAWRPYSYDLRGGLSSGCSGPVALPQPLSQLSDCGSMRPSGALAQGSRSGGSLCSVHSGVTLPWKFTLQPPARESVTVAFRKVNLQASCLSTLLHGVTERNRASRASWRGPK